MTETEEAVSTANDAAAGDASALVDYLRERDVRCPLCSYNLRGLQATRCPECGRGLRLGVWLAEPRLAAWVVALSASLLPAGVGVLLVVAVITSGWSTIRDMPNSLSIATGFFVAFIPVAAAVALLRRRFLRLSQGRQWLLATLLLLAATTAFVAYMVAVWAM